MCQLSSFARHEETEALCTCIDLSSDVFCKYFKTCPPIRFLCSPYDSLHWPQDLYLGKNLPLTHFMPGPGLIVNTLVQGFLITPGGKRGEEKIENPDLPVVFSRLKCRHLPRHDIRLLLQ